MACVEHLRFIEDASERLGERLNHVAKKDSGKALRQATGDGSSFDVRSLESRGKMKK